MTLPPEPSEAAPDRTADVAVVSGSLFRHPTAAAAWHVLQILVALRELGFEPYYHEDTITAGAAGPDDETERRRTRMGEFLALHGFRDRWGFWDPHQDARLGLDAASTTDLLWRARLVLHLSPDTRLPRRHDERHVFLDGQPARTAARLRQGDPELRGFLASQNRLARIGHDPGIDDVDLSWEAVPPPVVTSLWNPLPGRGEAPWITFAPEFDPASPRDPAWLDFLSSVPERARLLVVGPTSSGGSGWATTDAGQLEADSEIYRQFLRLARGEIVPAPEACKGPPKGFLSVRSAWCLAAGRPVVAEDTGLGSWLPVGEGLLTAADAAGARDALAAIEGDWERHSRAATALAASHLEAGQVLLRLLD